MKTKVITAIVTAAVGLSATFGAGLSAQEQADLSVIHRIKDEAFKHSQVMEHLFYMTEVHGPRLTNSPGLELAADWVAGTVREWGLANVALEPWDGAGRGWSTTHFEAHLREPGYLAMIGTPLAWTPGTDGAISGTPILAPLNKVEFWDFEAYEEALEDYFETWRGKLQGQFVLMEEAVHVTPITQAPSHRWSPEELAELARHPDPVPPIEVDPDNIEIPTAEHLRARFFAHAPPKVRKKLFETILELNNRLQRFLVEEGVALAIYPSWPPGDGGTVFPLLLRSSKPDAGPAPSSMVLTPEHYNRLVRLTERELGPVIEVEIEAEFHEDDTQGINIVAEIPGGKKKDEAGHHRRPLR